MCKKDDSTHFFKMLRDNVITFPDPHESSYGAETTFIFFRATVRRYLDVKSMYI